jgi:integrase
MTKPRDRASTDGLLPRMEARTWSDGVTVTYRFQPVGGKWINLGTDRAAALRNVLNMNGDNSDRGSVAELWRLYRDGSEWAELADATKTDYSQCWVQLEKRFAAATAAAITPPVVARYLRRERVDAPKRANREAALLSNLMNLAVERGDIASNPCKQVRRNKERPRTEAPDPAALVAFLEWARKREGQAHVLAGMAEFAALSGNRRAEFLKLHWPQVGDVVRLMRAKQRGRPTVEVLGISDALQRLFDRMRALAKDPRVGAVFPTVKGDPYTEQGFKAMWSKLVAKALAEKAIERRFTFHDLRAYYVTQHKAQRGALPDLHANPGTTARVYDRTKEVKRQSL